MELSGKLVESFEGAHVKKIVTCCPHCTTMLDNDYRQIQSYSQLGIKVMHHTEFIAEVLPKLPIKPSPVTATYHDPCYLARGRGITAAPRKLLHAAGVTITEAAHHGQNTQCCGAGGAQLFVADDTREQGKVRVNQRRFIELMQTQAATVAVACPYCPIMLRDAANALKRDDVEILDVAEIVARNLVQNRVGGPPAAAKIQAEG
jgi:Fe-S oxidoreductase